MSVWEVIFSDTAQTQIAGLDKSIRVRVLDKTLWLSENFDQIVPIPLIGNLLGFYKLRVGDYRVVYKFDREQRVIYIQLVEHRSKVYVKQN